ncbi:MAG: chemotaxis protein, partial [Methylobacteriaceae bacterium]|nr:chemotaxis protein [Methylobacteriaceae bacterium]
KLNEALQDAIPRARADLAEARGSTEAGAGAIMTLVEELLGLRDGGSPSAYQAAVAEKAMAILEACSFQDMTGQRLARVETIMAELERRLARFSAKIRIPDAQDVFDRESILREVRREMLIVEGPQNRGAGIGQDAVDQMFG